MGRLAVIVGHGLLGQLPAADAAEEPRAGALDRGDHVLLQRHGLDRYRAPHAIDHAANVGTLTALGCDRVLAIGSVGSLDPVLPVGTFLAPNDFVALHLGGSSFDDARGHVVPAFDRRWRADVVETWGRLAEPPLRDGGVYWQAIGPRFETPAEIRLMAAHADVVGMTLAAECVAAAEAGLAYAAVCVVDNLANGLAGEPLEPADHERGKRGNRAALLGALGAVVPALAGAAE